jgi:hypothetical protein
MQVISEIDPAARTVFASTRLAGTRGSETPAVPGAPAPVADLPMGLMSTSR